MRRSWLTAKTDPPRHCERSEAISAGSRDTVARLLRRLMAPRNDDTCLDRPFLVHRRDLVLAVAEPIEDLVGVLAEQRRTLHLDRRVGKIDRRADLDIATAGRMVDVDQKAAFVER